MINIVTITAVFVVCIFSILIYCFLNSGVIISWYKKIHNRFWHHYLKRKRIADISEEKYGLVDEKSFFAKVDNKLNATGWKERYSYLSAELFIAIVIILSLVSSFVLYCFFHKILLSIIVFIVVFAIPWCVLYFVEGIRYKETENQLMMFINLLENYSRTSDDLVDIISKTESYLNEPLKAAVRKFSWEAKHTGETDVAVKHILEKVPHRKFKEIIQNLEICRKHDTNYADVIKDIRVSLQEYLKSKEEKTSLRQNTRGNIFVMMLVGIIIIRLVNSFVEGGLLLLLQSNITGICIMAYIFVIVMIGVWQVVKIDRN